MGYLRPPSVWLRPNVAAVATITVAAAIGGFLTTVKTPDGESATRNIQCFTSTGSSSVCIRETGTIDASGSVIGQVALSGAIVHSLTGAIFGDKDGAGCTAIHVLNGVVTAQIATCP